MAPTFFFACTIVVLIGVGILHYRMLRQEVKKRRQLEHDKKILQKKLSDLEKSTEIDASRLDKIVTELDEALDEIRTAEKLEKLCNYDLLAIPPGTPQIFHEKTLDFANYLLRSSTKSFHELGQRDCFSRPGQWDLYWCLARASESALAVVKVKDENGITAELVQSLKNQVDLLRDIGGSYRPSFNFAFCKIFDQALPAVKEADVGADVLLVVAGNGLVPGGGARLIWLQAKKSSSNFPKYYLDCSYENTRGLQLDALAKVNVSSKGSFSAYVKYSTSLPFIPSLSLDLYMPSSPNLKVDLAVEGVRFPELITVLSSVPSQKMGSFKTPTEIVTFIDSVANKKPLFLVCATGTSRNNDQEWDAKILTEQLQQYYHREIGLSHSLVNKSTLAEGSNTSQEVEKDGDMNPSP